MPYTAADLFDHHATEPTHKRINKTRTEVLTVDGHEVEVARTYKVDWVFHEPHTATCDHAFFHSLDARGWPNQNDRTEYKTVVDGDDFQNAEWDRTRVTYKRHSRPVDAENPTDDQIREVMADIDRVLDEYEAAVARTSPHAAMRDRAPGSPLGVEDAEVGQVAWVHAKGKWRQGVVSKVGRSRVTVEYYVASSGSVTEKAGTAKKPVHAE